MARSKKNRKPKAEKSYNEKFIDILREELYQLTPEDIASVIFKAPGLFSTPEIKNAVYEIINPRLKQKVGFSTEDQDQATFTRSHKVLDDFFRPRFKALKKDKILGKMDSKYYLKETETKVSLTLKVKNSLGPNGRKNKFSNKITDLEKQIRADLVSELDFLVNTKEKILDWVRRSVKDNIFFLKPSVNALIEEAKQNLLKNDNELSAQQVDEVISRLAAKCTKNAGDKIDKFLGLLIDAGCLERTKRGRYEVVDSEKLNNSNLDDLSKEAKQVKDKKKANSKKPKMRKRKATYLDLETESSSAENNYDSDKDLYLGKEEVSSLSESSNEQESIEPEQNSFSDGCADLGSAMIIASSMSESIKENAFLESDQDHKSDSGASDPDFCPKKHNDKKNVGRKQNKKSGPLDGNKSSSPLIANSMFQQCPLTKRRKLNVDDLEKEAVETLSSFKGTLPFKGN